MMSLFTLLLLFLIFITLKYVGNKEHYVEIMNNEQPNGATKSVSDIDSLNNTTGNNTIDEIQKNQALIFELFIIEIEKYNNAKSLLLYDNLNDCILKKYKRWLDKIESNITTKTNKLLKTECREFQNNYCKTDEGIFNSDDELYRGRINNFRNSIDECYIVCQKEDISNLREYKRMFYNTLYDILIMNNVLQKITGNMTDEENANKYHYLINYNEDDSIAHIDILLDVFSPSDPSHENLVKEMHAFIAILSLEDRKFLAKEQKFNDEKEELLANYQAKNYEITYNIVPEFITISEETEGVIDEE